jgi:hypothetical protein
MRTPTTTQSTIQKYRAYCRDPQTSQTAEFDINAPTEGNADMQARDGFYGLLGVDPVKRAALEVRLELAQ